MLHLKEEKHLPVPPRRITPFFVASDVTTFLIQVGYLSHIFLSYLIFYLGWGWWYNCVYQQPEHGSTGGERKLFILVAKEQRAPADVIFQIFLAGLILQLISFVVFSCMLALFLYRVRRHSQGIWSYATTKGQAWTHDWRVLAAAMAISCVGIIVSHPAELYTLP